MIARSRPTWVLVTACILGAVIGAGPASAKLKTGLMDSLFSSGPAQRAQAFDDAVAARAKMVRLTVPWRAVATSKPTSPSDPGDPAYNFASIDAQVKDATARGLTVLLTINRAPDFAEQGERPPGVAPGTWKPDPEAFGAFARAVATRYSGTYGDLPRARFFQAWNEANLDIYLAPQYVGRKPVAAIHYRRMLNAFYHGVKRAQPTAKVVTTGTGPYGDPPGGHRTRPLVFWRRVLCLRGRRALKPAKCKQKARFDILAHHPINTSGGPYRSAIHPDDASTPDFKLVRRTLRAAERSKRILPRGQRRPLWATEIWWESKPPDPCGVGLKKHARWLRQSFRLLRRQGASAVFWLGLRDQKQTSDECGRATMQSGLSFIDGSRKPAFRAFRQFG